MHATGNNATRIFRKAKLMLCSVPSGKLAFVVEAFGPYHDDEIHPISSISLVRFVTEVRINDGEIFIEVEKT
jgi:hypothetical protein